MAFTHTLYPHSKSQLIIIKSPQCEASLTTQDRTANRWAEAWKHGKQDIQFRHHFRDVLCIYVYMYICIYVYMYICIYVYMYICIYVYMYICIYVNM